MKYRISYLLLRGPLAAYVMINFSQSLFYEGTPLKKSLANGLKSMSSFKFYKGQVGPIIVASLVLWALFFAAGLVVRSFYSTNYLIYLQFYSYLSKAAFFLTYLALYLVILINRITFYRLSRELK